MIVKYSFIDSEIYVEIYIYDLYAPIDRMV